MIYWHLILSTVTAHIKTIHAYFNMAGNHVNAKCVPTCPGLPVSVWHRENEYKQ